MILINIMGYFTSVFAQFCIIYVFGKMAKKKGDIKRSTLILIAITAYIQVIINLYISNFLSTVLTIFYFLYVFKKIYKCSFEETQNYSIIIWTIGLLLDVSIMTVINLFEIKFTSNIQMLIYKTTMSTVMYLIMILICNIKPFMKFINKLYQKMIKLKISLQQIIGIIIIYMTIGTLSSQNINNTMIVTFFLLLGISLMITILVFISKQYQVVMLKMTNEILEKDNETYLKIIKQYRIIKHNIENNLLGIKSVSNKKSKILIDNLIKDYNDSFYIKHDIESFPKGINGFILEKIYKYKDDDIKIVVENKVKRNILKTIGAKKYNILCEALGIALDNALEATSMSTEKILCINFKENKDKIIIKIMNTFQGKIEIEELGSSYTSKGLNHGLGLFSIFNRKQLQISVKIKDNFFINEIAIKKINK